jgi:hypothetical protein
MEQHKVGEYDKPSRSPKNPRQTPPSKNLNREDDIDFNSGPGEAEISPGKLDREEITPDRSGTDSTKGHEPYEFKTKNADYLLTPGSNNLGASGGAGGHNSDQARIDQSSLKKKLPLQAQKALPRVDHQMDLLALAPKVPTIIPFVARVVALMERKAEKGLE